MCDEEQLGLVATLSGAGCYEAACNTPVSQIHRFGVDGVTGRSLAFLWRAHIVVMSAPQHALEASHV